MPELIRWMFSEPIVLLILVSWIFSAIGRSMQKAAKKAKEDQKRGGTPRAGPQAGAGRRSGQPDPADIAREIRRAMGLEPAAASARPAPRAASKRVEPAEDVPELVIVEDVKHARRGHLREELAARDKRELGEDRFAQREVHVGERIRDRHLDLHVQVAQARTKRLRVKRSELFSLSRPASAIVAMEVLGKPIGLRDQPMPHDV